MFAFSFALVPFYRIFCEITGLNGKVFESKFSNMLGEKDVSRRIKVQFLTTLNGEMPWEFKPHQSSIAVVPGEVTRVLFSAKNLTENPMVAQAVPSISPGLAAQYFKKLECFCFRQQKLKGGELIEMPVVFQLDPALPAEYPSITLAYTLFDITPKPAAKK